MNFYPLVLTIAAYVDSNSEDSDSDMSDVGELDSDLENEKQLRYDRNVYREDMKVLKKEMRADLAAGEKTKQGSRSGS